MLFDRRTTFQNFVKIAVFRQGFRLLVFQGLHYKRMQTRFVVAEIMGLLSRAKCCPKWVNGGGYECLSNVTNFAIYWHFDKFLKFFAFYVDDRINRPRKNFARKQRSWVYSRMPNLALTYGEHRSHPNQSCPWVHFVWPDSTQPISWLTQPTTQPNSLQLKKCGPNPTRPNTTNNGAYSLVVTYFCTQNLSRPFSQPSRKIKFNCLVQPNLI